MDKKLKFTYFLTIRISFFSETQFDIFAVSSHQRWCPETWSSLHLFFQSNSKPMWNSSWANVEFRPSYPTQRIQIQRNGSSSGKNDTLRKTGKSIAHYSKSQLFLQKLNFEKKKKKKSQINFLNFFAKILIFLNFKS